MPKVTYEENVKKMIKSLGNTDADIVCSGFYFEKNTVVEEISYDYRDYDDGFISIQINIKSNIRDIVELKAYECDEKGNLMTNDYYSAALTIEGTKKTKAKIPVDLIGKKFLKIIVKSYNMGQEIENL